MYNFNCCCRLLYYKTSKMPPLYVIEYFPCFQNITFNIVMQNRIFLIQFLSHLLSPWRFPLTHIHFYTLFFIICSGGNNFLEHSPAQQKIQSMNQKVFRSRKVRAFKSDTSQCCDLWKQKICDQWKQKIWHYHSRLPGKQPLVIQYFNI